MQKTVKKALRLLIMSIDYASALQQDNFYGVQFHPEKSSTAGEQILKNFLNCKHNVVTDDRI